MVNTTKDWFKGNFPLWLMLLMLSFVGYLGKRSVDNIDANNHQQDETLKFVLIDQNERKIQIAVLQEQNRQLTQAVNEMKEGQRQVISELKAINAQLKVP